MKIYIVRGPSQVSTTRHLEPTKTVVGVDVQLPFMSPLTAGLHP
jgi:hypothetical protein